LITRKADDFAGLTLDDPRLKTLEIGIQMVGDDGSNAPPAHALTRRGMVDNIHRYMLYGDYGQANPPAEIVRAVERGDVDAAIVWGPLAGFFAAQSKVPLRIEPVTPLLDEAQWPMQFDISVGVRKNDQKLLREVDAVLARRHSDIDALLRPYHVPVVER